MSVILYRDYMIAYGYRRQLKPTTPRTAPVSKKTKKMSVGIIQLEPRVSPRARLRVCERACAPVCVRVYAYAAVCLRGIVYRACACLCAPVRILYHLKTSCIFLLDVFFSN